LIAQLAGLLYSLGSVRIGLLYLVSYEAVQDRVSPPGDLLGIHAGDPYIVIEPLPHVSVPVEFLHYCIDRKGSIYLIRRDIPHPRNAV
jgi:hypothetical protein